MADKKINIFYTDDDHDDIAFFKDAVLSAGKEINAITTFDGGTLLSLLNNPPPAPAIVFLDWNMPGQTGGEVLKEIRTGKETKDIPIVIFSTSNESGDIEDARRLGANMFITKPSSFRDIVKVISYCLTIDWKVFKADDKTFVYKIN